MTQQARIEHSDKYIRNIKRFERMFIKPVYNALQSQITDFTKVLREEGLQRAKNQLDSIIIDGNIAEIIKEIYLTIGIYSANRTLAQIAKSVRPLRIVPANKSVELALEFKGPGFGFNEIIYQFILDYFRLYLLSKAVLPITQTTKDRIREILTIGEREGWGADRMAYEIDTDEMTLSRARMIVRTETLKAMQYGRQVGQNQSIYESESEWIAANDHRTRNSHRDVDGKRVDEGKRFRVPIYKREIIIGFDFMLGPGDVNASAGNVINCRCTMATVAKRDKQGNLILKKNNNSGISVILPEEVFQPHTIIII
jgi:hypothetical protein